MNSLLNSLRFAVALMVFFSSEQILAELRDEITFIQAFDSTLRSSKAAKIQAARVEQSQERVSQAFGAILPSISLNASYLHQNEGSGGSTSSSTARITLIQPLFSGFQEISFSRATKANNRSEAASLKYVQYTLYAETARSYANVLLAEADLRHLETLLKISKQRVSELQTRARIGKTRSSEVLTARSQVAAVEAQTEAARLTLTEVRNEWHRLTGLSSTAQLSPLLLSIPQPLPGADTYLSTLENRPDLIALSENIVSAEESVKVAKGAHLPHLDFAANYFLKRTGVLENSKWDFGLTLSFPIFQGGILRSQVKEAQWGVNENEYRLRQSESLAKREIRNLFQSVVSGIYRIQSLTTAAELAEKNFLSQSNDYRLGLVSNLDVIQSLNASVEAKRALDRVRFESQAAYAALQTASAQLPTDALRLMKSIEGKEP